MFLSGYKVVIIGQKKLGLKKYICWDRRGQVSKFFAIAFQRKKTKAKNRFFGHPGEGWVKENQWNVASLFFFTLNNF